LTLTSLKEPLWTKPTTRFLDFRLVHFYSTGLTLQAPQFNLFVTFKPPPNENTSRIACQK
jgi:hypothetical protein